MKRKPKPKVESPTTPEEQVQKGEFPSRKDQFQPGVSGNPAGRMTAGATIREQINALAESDPTEDGLRALARDRKAPWTKRAAAERILRTLEAGDLADMEPLLNGTTTLQDLRASGVNTEVIKKIKVKTRTLFNDGEAEGTEVEREVELHDRAGDDFDRVFEHTDGKGARLDEGKPTDNVAINVTVREMGDTAGL